MAEPSKVESTLMTLNKNDPHSFANPEAVFSENMEIDWDIDFSQKMIRGSVTYYLTKRNNDVTHIIFDTQDLNILSVKNNKRKKLEYTMCEEVVPFGVPMRIKLPIFDKKQRGYIKIEYETSGSTAVQWVSAHQTNGKTHPFMYNQGQAINNRSLLPCQDTPSTKSAFYAEVTVPRDFVVVMSGIRVGGGAKTINGGTHKRYSFEQNILIPSYLISIAVAKFDWVDISPRTRIFAEESILRAAAFEFAETEYVLRIAEKLCGEYVWGPYDIVVLPPNFPYNAMENPCVTFVTPTIIAGDRSLANAIAHEVAHSWSGNLVTNKNFEHFWLNEGFTMYLERKIMGILNGERYRQLLSLDGWKILKEEVQSLGPLNPLTCLVPDLEGIHPEEGFNAIPYEKGYVFVYYLVEIVGGATVFGPYFQDYVRKYRYKSIDSNTFKNHFIDYFQKKGLKERIQEIDWDTWFYGPGMPPYAPRYDTTLSFPCYELRNMWLSWDPSNPEHIVRFSKDDLKSFKFPSPQMQEFLALLLEDENPFPIEKAKAMQAAYDMNSIQNCEIRFRWLRLCIRAKWRQQLPLVAEFLTHQGRVSFNQPLYRDLFNWEEIRPLALELFQKDSPNMMPIIAEAIAVVLEITN